MNGEDKVKVEFDNGTIVVRAPLSTRLPLPAGFVYDKRIDAWRAEACEYASLITALYNGGHGYEDEARQYTQLKLNQAPALTPRDYQQEAITAWRNAERRGVVVLPTGTGKSFVAQMAIRDVRRSTLVVVPTIDLLEQWAQQLEKAFGCRIGVLGGGSHEVQEITVSTYDSAVLMMEHIGNRFGLLIVDECHHLSGETYRLLCRFCLAPFRLGLTATPETGTGSDVSFEDVLGDICYRKQITDLRGFALAPYRTKRIPVELEGDELMQYQQARDRYVGFLRQQRIDLSQSDGWKQFLFACVRQPGGRRALDAYFEQRRISRGCRRKLQWIWRLLKSHSDERVLIFTADNRTAYDIGQRFYLPVLTHHTKLSERHDILARFRSNELPFLVTSRVLNEGVDVPEASVGIVVSGTGSVREHVQRLGRILRPMAGKEAVLYELISVGTNELNVSERRRQHDAYEGTDSLPYQR